MPGSGTSGYTKLGAETSWSSTSSRLNSSRYLCIGRNKDQWGYFQELGQVSAPAVHSVRLVLLHPRHLPDHVRPLPAGLPPLRDRDQGGDEERQGQQEDAAGHPEVSPGDHADGGR